MAISGKKVATVEEIIELMFQYGGKVRHVSKHLQCSPRAVYEFLDVYPEVVEAREKAMCQMGDAELESSYDTLKALLDRKDDEPGVAFNAAKLIVTKAKKSRYNTEQKEVEALGGTLAGMAALAAQNKELQKKLDKLDKKEKSVGW